MVTLSNEKFQVFLKHPVTSRTFCVCVKKKDTIKTKMTIDEGLKIIISGGMLAPEKNEI